MRQVTTVIQQIEGRQDDILWGQPLNSKDQVRPIYPDFLRRSVLFVDGQITDYQISQVAPDLVTVALKPEEKGHFSSLEKEIVAVWRSLDCLVPRIELTDLTASTASTASTDLTMTTTTTGGGKKRRIRNQTVLVQGNPYG